MLKHIFGLPDDRKSRTQKSHYRGYRGDRSTFQNWEVGCISYEIHERLSSEK